MALHVGKKAPHFKGEAVMPDGSFKEISLEDYLGKKYVLLYFYPLDFTFVCPSEIIALDKAISKFEEREVQLIGCSVDSKFTHLAWRNTSLDKGGIGAIKHPLLSDITKQISRDYNILTDDSVALRALFLIDKNGIVQHALVNNLSIGRSVDEALRIVDAVQFNVKHGDVCPANWKLGDEGMKPTSEGVASYLSKM